MATTTISSTTLTPYLNPNRSRRFTPLSSSHSVFFSYNANNFNGFRLGRASRPNNNGRRRGMSCTCLFGLGVPELVVIAGVVVLVFGPKKLPEVGKSIGKTVKSFQQAAKEFESELKKDVEVSADDSNDKIATKSEEEKDEDAKVSSAKDT